MKTKNILIILTISAAFLTACQDELMQATTTSQSIQDSSKTNVTVGDENIIDQSVAVENKHSLADVAAYESAMDLDDTSFCNKIVEQIYKENCLVDVKDQVVLEKALGDSEMNTCNTLSTIDKQEACKIRIEAAEKEKQVIVEEQKTRDALMSVTNEIIQAGDVTRCKELEQNRIAGCELNILINAANHSQNQSLCEKASTSETIAECKSSYKAKEEEPQE